jgi:hypothetical protein
LRRIRREHGSIEIHCPRRRREKGIDDPQASCGGKESFDDAQAPAAAKKALTTRKRRAATKKALTTRKRRGAAKKAAATRNRLKSVDKSAAPRIGSPERVVEIDQRIAIIRGNLRELTEQAAAFSGSSTEELMAERIATQEAKLEALRQQRERLLSGS